MISILIACYNEEAVIPRLHERITEAARAWGAYEVVVVDDGSSDGGWEMLQSISRRDPRWRTIRLSRNFGQQIALSAALHYAMGECAVLIDADLQDPPELIDRFLEKWREGYQVVYAVRSKRKEHFFKRACYKIFYRILSGASDLHIPLDAGDFCLLDRKIVDLLKNMPERHRFLRGVRAWVGFRQTGIVYERSCRAAGEPKYTYRKLAGLARDGIYSSSTLPLRMLTWTGLLLAVCAGAAALVSFFLCAIAPAGATRPISGAAMVIDAVFFVGGLQLVGMGVVGEYLGRVHEQVKGRPLWVIAESSGLGDPQSGGAQGGAS